MKDFISYENDLDGYTNKIRSRKDFSLKKRQLLSKVLLKQNKSLKNNNIQVENIKNSVLMLLNFPKTLLGIKLSKITLI